MAHSARQSVTAYVALGANLGDARKTVLRAFDALAQLPTTQLIQRSQLYRTAPLEAKGPDFFNAVAQIDTCLTAYELLDALQAIENHAGRLRPYLNAPRTLDLDLLFYGEAHVFSPRLTLPHPRWHERAFVLYPLADVWPQRVNPEDLMRLAIQGIERWTQDGS
jgi:2-amino-4-hydroxy-6-hydroxymethyldihydropteridine diphosphokinase